MSVSVQVFDEYQRVCPRTGRKLEPGSQPIRGPVRLRAGRGEFASFQLVVGPFSRRGGSAKVKLSALKQGGKGEAAIPPSQFDLFAEWYVFSGEPMPPRRWERARKPGPAAGRHVPDPLVPLRVFDGSLPLGLPGNAAPGQRYQGLWVDLFVPGDARPGDYEGKLTVTVGRQSHEVPLALTVDRFRQPDKLSFTFLMNNYVDSISTGWKGLRDDLDRHTTARYLGIERSFWRTAHDHRSAFYYLPYTHSGYVYPAFAPPLTGGGPNKRVKSWTQWDRHFGPYFDGSAFAGTRRGELPVPRFFLPISLTWPANFLKWGRPGYADEFKAVGADMARHFKQKGWTRTCFDMFLNHKQRYKLFPWDCEEVRFLEDNQVHYTFRKLWEGTLDHRTTRPVRFDYTLGTTWVVHEDMHSEISEFTDLFIGSSNTTALDPKRAEQLKKRGTEFCLCGGGSTMADSIRATAFWPLQFWIWGGDSYMVWNSTIWGEEPLRHVPGNGRTTMLYPGESLGLDEALPSLRLKTLRNMHQVIERYEAAAASGRDNRKARRLAAAAMGIPYADWFPTEDPYFSGSEEKPIAGWRQVSLDNLRSLANRALALTR